MKTLRFCWRALKAYLFPMAFAQWVNSERCYICVNNDADGTWYVEIGAMVVESHRELRCAMLTAFLKAECQPDWSWTTDFLKTL